MPPKVVIVALCALMFGCLLEVNAKEAWKQTIPFKVGEIQLHLVERTDSVFEIPQFKHLGLHEAEDYLKKKVANYSEVLDLGNASNNDPIIVLGCPAKNEFLNACLGALNLTALVKSRPSDNPRKPFYVRARSDSKVLDRAVVHVLVTEPGKSVTRFFGQVVKGSAGPRRVRGFVIDEFTAAPETPQQINLEAFRNAYDIADNFCQAMRGSTVVVGASFDYEGRDEPPLQRRFIGDDHFRRNGLVNSIHWVYREYISSKTKRLVFLGWKPTFWGDLAFPLGLFLLKVCGATELLHAGSKVGTSVSPEFIKDPEIFIPGSYSSRDAFGNKGPSVRAKMATSHSARGPKRSSLHICVDSPLDETRDFLQDLLAHESFGTIDLESCHFARAAELSGGAFDGIFHVSDVVVAREGFPLLNVSINQDKSPNERANLFKQIATWIYQHMTSSATPLKGGPEVYGDPPSLYEFFVGRSSKLVEIKEVLMSKRLCFVTGLTGIGKTELILQFIHRYGAELQFAVVLWLDAGSGLESGELRLTEQATDKRSDKDLVSFIKGTEGRVLLVIDNVNSDRHMDELNNGWLKNPISHLYVLVASQLTLDVPGSDFAGNEVNLTKLGDTDSMLILLQASSPLESRNSSEWLEYARDLRKEEFGALKHLVKNLEGHPLALRVSGNMRYGLKALTWQMIASAWNRNILDTKLRFPGNIAPAVRASMTTRFETLTESERNTLGRIVFWRGGFTPFDLFLPPKDRSYDDFVTVSTLKHMSLLEVTQVGVRTHSIVAEVAWQWLNSLGANNGTCAWSINAALSASSLESHKDAELASVLDAVERAFEDDQRFECPKDLLLQCFDKYSDLGLRFGRHELVQTLLDRAIELGGRTSYRVWNLGILKLQLCDLQLVGTLLCESKVMDISRENTAQVEYCLDYTNPNALVAIDGVKNRIAVAEEDPHPDNGLLFVLYADLGWRLCDLKAFTEAEQYLDKAQIILDADDSSAIQVNLNIYYHARAKLLIDLGRRSEGIHYAEKGFKIYERERRPFHAAVARIAFAKTLADVSVDQYGTEIHKQYAIAIEMLKTIVGRREPLARAYTLYGGVFFYHFREVKRMTEQFQLASEILEENGLQPDHQQVEFQQRLDQRMSPCVFCDAQSHSIETLAEDYETAHGSLQAANRGFKDLARRLVCLIAYSIKAKELHIAQKALEDLRLAVDRGLSKGEILDATNFRTFTAEVETIMASSEGHRLLRRGEHKRARIILEDAISNCRIFNLPRDHTLGELYYGIALVDFYDATDRCQAYRSMNRSLKFDLEYYGIENVPNQNGLFFMRAILRSLPEEGCRHPIEYSLDDCQEDNHDESDDNYDEDNHEPT